MARVVKQFVNESTIDLENPNKLNKIYQFGIQAKPGSTVRFNGDTKNVITIGTTGIFQADLDEGSYITSIEVTDNKGADYYIDVIMEEGS